MILWHDEWPTLSSLSFAGSWCTRNWLWCRVDILSISWMKTTFHGLGTLYFKCRCTKPMFHNLHTFFEIALVHVVVVRYFEWKSTTWKFQMLDVCLKD
jgi:hypothetical protein